MYKLKKYIGYRRRARNEYSLHSPFMFDLYNAVFKPSHKNNKQFDHIEQIRTACLRNATRIQVNDLGAGSQVNHGNTRSIADITRSTGKRPRHARFIANLAQYLQSKTIIELGTSVGISTLYLAAKNNAATVYTIEGADSIRAVANENFAQAGLKNIVSMGGNFDTELPTLLQQTNGFDMLFVDGNHTYEATKRYFNTGKSYAASHSVIVFDDIYWSEGMTRAWEEITNDPAVTASVDMFEFGLVFFNKDLSKQHFVLRY